jgi:hypothetical protein
LHGFELARASQLSRPVMRSTTLTCVCLGALLAGACQEAPRGGDAEAALGAAAVHIGYRLRDYHLTLSPAVLHSGPWLIARRWDSATVDTIRVRMNADSVAVGQELAPGPVMTTVRFSPIQRVSPSEFTIVVQLDQCAALSRRELRIARDSTNRWTVSADHRRSYAVKSCREGPPRPRPPFPP